MEKINTNGTNNKRVKVDTYLSFNKLMGVLFEKKGTIIRGAYYQPNAKKVRRRFMVVEHESKEEVFAYSIPGDTYFVELISKEYPLKFLRYLPINPYDAPEYQNKPVFYLDLETGEAYHSSYSCVVSEGEMAFVIAFDSPERIRIDSKEYGERFVILDPASDITK